MLLERVSKRARERVEKASKIAKTRSQQYKLNPRFIYIAIIKKIRYIEN